MDPVFSLSNQTFKYFLGYSSVVIVKSFFVNILTGNRRVMNRAYLNEEDAKASIGGAPDGKPRTTATIDRLKRISLNDLENVVPFVLVGLLYTATGPDPDTARLHFQIFTASRLLHTLVYLLAVPQPARAICWTAGLVSTLSMAYRVFSSGAF